MNSDVFLSVLFALCVFKAFEGLIDMLFERKQQPREIVVFGTKDQIPKFIENFMKFDERKDDDQ